MFNLISADWYRTLHGKAFKCCFLLTLGWVFFCGYVQKATIGFRENLSGGQITIDYVNAFFNYDPVTLPLIIFCSSFIANDFKQGTIKHYIEKGIPRWKYVLSKLMVGWAATICFLFGAFAMGVFCYKMFFGGNLTSYMTVTNLLAYVLGEALCHMAAATFAIFIAFVIRNGSASMAVNFILLFFGYLGLNSLNKLLHLKFDITSLWAIGNIGGITIETAVLWLPLAVLTFIGYFVVFHGMLYLIYKKKDLA